MESMRDINRVMEREIAKGSCPLKLDHIEFGDYSYQEITSREKLMEVLSYLSGMQWTSTVWAPWSPRSWWIKGWYTLRGHADHEGSGQGDGGLSAR